jgi:hypothetical protein
VASYCDKIEIHFQFHPGIYGNRQAIFFQGNSGGLSTQVPESRLKMAKFFAPGGVYSAKNW